MTDTTQLPKTGGSSKTRQTMESLQQTLASLPKALRKEWFVVGPPWGKGDWVICGHNDPHIGQPVADCEDFDGEHPHSLDAAAWIAAANPLAVERLLAERNALLAALAGLEPYLDAIVCYASTMDEHEPNRLAVNARAAIDAARGGAA